VDIWCFSFENNSHVINLIVWSWISWLVSEFSQNFQVGYSTRRSFKFVLLLIALTWTLSLLISAPPLAGWNDWTISSSSSSSSSSSNSSSATFKNTVGQCRLTEQTGFVIYSALGSFYVPLIVMTTVYAKIFLAARQRLRSKRYHSIRQYMVAYGVKEPSLMAHAPSKKSWESFLCLILHLKIDFLCRKAENQPKSLRNGVIMSSIRTTNNITSMLAKVSRPLGRAETMRDRNHQHKVGFRKRFQSVPEDIAETDEIQLDENLHQQQQIEENNQVENLGEISGRRNGNLPNNMGSTDFTR